MTYGDLKRGRNLEQEGPRGKHRMRESRSGGKTIAGCSRRKRASSQAWRAPLGKARPLNTPYRRPKPCPMTDLKDFASRAALMEGLIVAALNAGAEIWRIFEAGFEVEIKTDASPVTIADRSAEAIILEAILRLTPDIPVIAEEEAAAGRVPDVGERFYLVDPLDGTKEFVRRGTDFTVNIGLIEHGEPTLGVIYAPALRELYVGDAVTGTAW